ncbi:hypothetical protein ACWDZ4_20660 [Streptomyces sp. NPDC003016]
MAATQQNPVPDDEEEPAPRRWMEPRPDEVSNQIDLYQSMDTEEFTEALAAFVLAGTRKTRPEDYELQACAIRSPRMARRALRLIEKISRDLDKYLPTPDSESQVLRRNRVSALRSRADKERQFLHLVLAGDAARRGFFLPDPNPRGRARRRLADENPVRFLELLREEEQADKDRAAAEAAERKKAKAAAKAAARETAE